MRACVRACDRAWVGGWVGGCVSVRVRLCVVRWYVCVSACVSVFLVCVCMSVRVRVCVASAATGRLVVSRHFSCCFLSFHAAVGGGGLGNKHTRSLRHENKLMHTRLLRRMRINSCISALCRLFFVVLSKRFPVASLALRECSAMYNPRLCLSSVLLLRIAKVPPPSRSPALLSAWRAYPFFLDQHIDVFAAVSVSDPVLAFVIGGSAMPDRSRIDFRALCDDQHVLWSSWVSYVSQSS